MALKLLIHGISSSLYALSSGGFTKANYEDGYTNTTLNINTPRGVLGGSVAAVSAGNDLTVVPCTKALAPVGLFVLDAASRPFDNNMAAGSGKLGVIRGMATVEVDVYETRNAADDADLTYAVGNKLYSSAKGFLTNEASDDGTVVAIVVKAPSVASPSLVVEMRI